MAKNMSMFIHLTNSKCTTNNRRCFYLFQKNSFQNKRGYIYACVWSLNRTCGVGRSCRSASWLQCYIQTQKQTHGSLSCGSPGTMRSLHLNVVTSKAHFNADRVHQQATFRRNLCAVCCWQQQRGWAVFASAYVHGENHSSYLITATKLWSEITSWQLGQT